MKSQSAKPKRRLGPDDRRLQVRRCFNCRTGHRKCDPIRPCSACHIRGIRCVDETRGQIEHPVVPISPEPRLAARIEEDWSYCLQGFFEVVGDEDHLPVPLEALARESLAQYLYPENPVWHAAIAVGAVHRGSQAFDGDVGSKDHLSSIACSAVERAKEMLCDDESFGLASVVAALLVDIYLLMTDTTLTHIVTWTEQTCDPLIRKYLIQPSTDPFLVSLRRTFWILDCVFALEFDVDTEFADYKLFLHSDIESILPELGVMDYSSQKQHLANAADYVLIKITQLVRLNRKSVSLRHRRYEETLHAPLASKSAYFPAEYGRKQESVVEDPGYDISACRQEAECLARDFEKLRLVLDATLLSDHLSSVPPWKQANCSLLSIYADLSTLGLPKLFEGSTFNASLQIRQSSFGSSAQRLLEPEANARIMRLLCSLEERLLQDIPSTTIGDTPSSPKPDSNVCLESVLYFPALTVLALEVRCVELRRRVKVLFHSIKARGFVVAGTGLHDIELAWRAIASGCGQFCLCGPKP